MKVDYSEGKFIVTLSDKSRGNERVKALYELRYVHFHEWIDGNTVAFDLGIHSEQATAGLVKTLENGVKILGADISPTASEIFEKYAEKRRLMEEERRQRERAEQERSRAINKVKNGCGFCESLKWNGKKWICEACEKPCAESAKEIEMLFELWKESGYKVFQRPTAFPVAECKHLEVLRCAENLGS